MKAFLSPLFMFLLHIPMSAQTDTSKVVADTSQARPRVELLTTKGRIVVELYNETPHHRDNFLKLVRKGYYDGNLWHRVISDFMIQTGDSTTRHAKEGDDVGSYDLGYRIPAEIHFPQFFHKRGALAAAREGDSVNPERESSASQFYIVYGSVMTTNGLNRAQQRLDENTEGKVQLTTDIRNYYMRHGGTPHLDGQYTVFGEVVEGMDVVRDIDYVPTNEFDRPMEDVRIIAAKVIE